MHEALAVGVENRVASLNRQGVDSPSSGTARASGQSLLTLSERSIATHRFGIPMTVRALPGPPPRPAGLVGAMYVSPAVPVAAQTLLYDLRLENLIGLAIGPLLVGDSAGAGLCLAP